MGKSEWFPVDFPFNYCNPLMVAWQVQFMLDYLGFPDSQDDVDKLLKVLDRRRELLDVGFDL